MIINMPNLFLLNQYPIFKESFAMLIAAKLKQYLLYLYTLKDTQFY